MFNDQYRIKTLLIFTIFFAFNSSLYSQLELGFRYSIKKKSTSYLYYSFSGPADTLIDSDQNIDSIIIHEYIPGITTKIFSTHSSGDYTIITETNPSLQMCGRRLKAGLFQKDDDSSGRIYIDFWGISCESPKCKAPNYINQSKRRGTFYYQIPIQETLANSMGYIKVRYAATDIGVATVPFKYRFGYKRDTTRVPNDASTSISAGFYVGRKWGHTTFYADKSKTATNTLSFTLGGFFTPAIISISPDNTFPTTDSIKIKSIGGKPNEFGLSAGAAAMLSIKNFNIGFFTGFDFTLTGASKLWYYSNKPWIGFGIGYKISILGDQ